MTDAEIDKRLNEIVAAFSTVIATTTRTIARHAAGTVNRHTMALELQRKADDLPQELHIAKNIIGNIANSLDDKPIKHR